MDEAQEAATSCQRKTKARGADRVPTPCPTASGRFLSTEHGEDRRAAKYRYRREHAWAGGGVRVSCICQQGCS